MGTTVAPREAPKRKQKQRDGQTSCVGCVLGLGVRLLQSGRRFPARPLLPGRVVFVAVVQKSGKF